LKCHFGSGSDVPFGDGLIAAVAELQVADAVDQPGGVEGELLGGGGEQGVTVALGTVADTGDVPRPLVASAHLDVGTVEQAAARSLEQLSLVDADRQRRFDMAQDENGSQPHGHGLGEGVANLGFDVGGVNVNRWPIANREVRRQARGVFGVMALAPGLDLVAQRTGDDGDEDPTRGWGLHTGGTVSFASTDVQPNRELLSPERFLSEAAQLHQTWIRRFDAQHRRRPRPPEIEAERLRLVRRLQLVQRLQQESDNNNPAELTTKLRELKESPREARLVEGDQPFLAALLQTWEAAQLPQASTIAAGANPPKPSGTVEFRW
jgi:hypothetical protein